MGPTGVGSVLDPRQLGLVRREYQGPARISGPAGTGKTLVALHRLAWLAERYGGRLLYITFVRNLPQVASAVYRRIAPTSAARVEFVDVHSWAHDLLLRRGIRCDGDRAAVAAAFEAAWHRCGGPLGALAAGSGYWREEIDHVIKGCGLGALEEYLRLPRHGRGLRLDRAARTAMWALYQEYERRLRASGAADHNDLVLAATAELARSGLEQPYTAVVADEAQDVNLVGLRLLHALGGDRPNGLLLVGDGQQAVYPMGSRLADAGIPIQGRGEILRINYRNSEGVLAVARELDAVNHFDEDALPLREVEATVAGGATRHYTATTAEDHDVELVTALQTCPVGPGDIALLTTTREAAQHYRGVLHAAQIPAVNLADYTGRRIDAVKVGTIRRAKGLEFRAVFLPDHGRADARLAGGGYQQLAGGRDVWLSEGFGSVGEGVGPTGAGLAPVRGGVRLAAAGFGAGGGFGLAGGGARVVGGSGGERREVRIRQALVGLTRARDYLWTGCVIGG
jgi:superfamily I DNA/RNA helicase